MLAGQGRQASPSHRAAACADPFLFAVFCSVALFTAIETFAPVVFLKKAGAVTSVVWAATIAALRLPPSRECEGASAPGTEPWTAAAQRGA